jgi:hypothetical protein
VKKIDLLLAGSVALLITLVISTGIFFHIHGSSFERGYEAGVADGFKSGYQNALQTTPPSDDLEFVCAGLWLNQQEQIYVERTNRKEKAWMQIK